MTTTLDPTAQAAVAPEIGNHILAALSALNSVKEIKRLRYSYSSGRIHFWAFVRRCDERMASRQVYEIEYDLLDPSVHVPIELHVVPFGVRHDEESGHGVIFDRSTAADRSNA
jgi:hypothetical protein